MIRVGLVGARGYVGQEMVKLLSRHSQLELAWMSSQSNVGQLVSELIPGAPVGLKFIESSPQVVAGAGADVIVLALPNNISAAYVDALGDQLLVDLSADYRFDDSWTYGLPELNRQTLAGTKRISNPGCYATAMQLGLAPVLGQLQGLAHCFGVSGYSGAGTKPSPKNDPQQLADNLMPYSLAGHIHENEVSRQLRHRIRFMPHVAAWFRGISMTIATTFKMPVTADDLLDRFAVAYKNEPLVTVQRDAPHVRDAAGSVGASIGGFTVHGNGQDAAWVVTLDNLLKGAASQALQNINLSLGIDELEGVQ
ncbi:MAG: N-acetyl-gamma-glutamyl-phosphate reductase [Lysobacteraceae bacterium]|nr:MAG: N-acetyl-gamma-glutamyl-phosphate reductase [Xanthomonadaceae bacterium]